MTFFTVILWIVIGFIAGGMIGTEMAPLFGIRHQEGASAYFGLLVMSPIGALAGAFFGYYKTKSYGEDTAKRRRFVQLTLAMMIAVPACLFVFEKIRTRDHLDSSTWLTSHIRLPPGVAAPDKSAEVVFELRSDKESRKSSPSTVSDWELKDGRFVTQGSVEVYRATTNRTMAVNIGNGPTYVFKLKTPARPKTYSYEGPWQKPDAVEGGASGAGDGMELRAAM